MDAPALSHARISLFSPLVPGTPSSTAVGESGSPGTANGQWERILDDLLRLKNLEDDWDGQGSQVPDPANVDAATRWVKEMRCWRQALPPTRVYPGTTGEVVLEWRAEAFQLAAEISTPGRLEWLLHVPDQPIKQWQTDTLCTWVVSSER